VNWIVIVIILSVLFYLFFVLFTGVDDVLEALEAIDLTYIPLILGIVFLAYLLRGFRWNYYLNNIGIRVKQSEGLLLFFSGLSMLVTPMMVSGAIKVGLVKAKHGAPMSSSFPIVIVERLTDLVGLLLLIVIAGGVLAFFSSDLYFISVMLFVVIFLVVVISIIRSKRLCMKVISWMGKLHPLRRARKSLIRAYSTMYTLLTPRMVAVAGGIAFVSWGIQGLAFHLVVRHMGLDLDLLESMFIFAFPTVLGIISQLPGGIGAEEGGMLALMLHAGLESSVSVAAILLFRILTLWFGLVMGIIALKYFTAVHLDDEDEKEGEGED
jgi:uncharacterized protein (TIRG00374 family)